MALRQMAADPWRHADSFDEIFAEREDPWISSSGSERERFSLTMSMLAAADRERFERAVEIGCAEGIFTELLAPYCVSLEALDYSELALARAEKRVASPHVAFRQWNLRRDPLTSHYDLIVAMGVLTSLYRPASVKKTCDELIRALEPGGFLLFSDVRQSKVFEDAWWGRLVLRGGEQIRRLFARRADLETVARGDTDSHVFALFRKSAA